MKTALVICHGFFGDHLFASSIAKKLIEEKQFTHIDYVVGFPQIVPLLKLNPYISNVIFTGVAGPSPAPIATHYDKVIQLGTLSLLEPPAVEFQKLAGVKNPSPEFTVYTDPVLDTHYHSEFYKLRQQHDCPIIAIMNNWEPKAYRFTEEEYRINDDVPDKGYGGRFRDINYIVSRLQEKFITISVGTPAGITQFMSGPTGHLSLLEEASVLKQCDYFIGAEGGLANLAGGVGCKTIIGSEFLAMLYGWRGCIRPIGAPMLGPHNYFLDQKHSMLSPFLTDEEFANTAIAIIENDLQLVYDWHTNTTMRRS